MNTLLQKLRKSEGFTLLELLVVVAIIAILATLILANLNRARRQAQDAKVQSEVKAISDALQLYQTDTAANLAPLDNNGNPPIDVSGSSAGPLSVLSSGSDPVLKTVPTHPVSGNSYHYAGDIAAGGFTYTVSGNLISKTGCFSITDGAASTSTVACP
ncbi:MAG: type II secretion system protein [Patescibacteria group bacterium]